MHSTLPQGLKSLGDHPLWTILTDDACVSVVIYEPSGKILFANRRSKMGADAPLVGLTPLEIMGEEGGGVLQDAIARTVASNSPIAYEGNWHGARFLGVLRPLEVGGTRVVLGTFRSAVDVAPEQWAAWHGIDSARSDHHRGALDRLTPRELDVFRLIGDGLPSLEVAEKLGLSVKTVEWYRAQLGQKLGARNRVELARMAIAMGLTAAPMPAARNGSPTAARKRPKATRSE